MLEHALLFSLSANKKLTQDVADRLGIELGKVTVNHFSDGETICEPLDSVRDKNCYILLIFCFILPLLASISIKGFVFFHNHR